MSNTKALMQFIFPNSEKAQNFIRLIRHWKDVTFCQQPRPYNDHSLDDQVLVRGTGSIIFDMKLESMLIEAAEKEGGTMIS